MRCCTTAWQQRCCMHIRPSEMPSDMTVLRCSYMTDLIIALLQNYAAAAALFPASPGARADEPPLPEPMLPGNWDSATGVCLHDESLQAAALHGTEPVRLLTGALTHGPVIIPVLLGSATSACPAQRAAAGCRAAPRTAGVPPGSMTRVHPSTLHCMKRCCRGMD